MDSFVIVYFLFLNSEINYLVIVFYMNSRVSLDR